MEFDHIAIVSTDIKKSVEWYVKNLECTIEYADKTWAMLNCCGTKLALVLKDHHPGHIAFKVQSSLKFPCAADQIKQHRDSSSYYYGADPDGNIIEWVAYTDEEE